MFFLIITSITIGLVTNKYEYVNKDNKWCIVQKYQGYHSGNVYHCTWST